jgi:hypothetical protein
MIEQSIPFIFLGLFVVIGIYTWVQNSKTKNFFRTEDIQVPEPSENQYEIFQSIERNRQQNECWVYIQFNKAKQSFLPSGCKHDYLYVVVDGKCRGSFLMSTVGIAGHIDGGSIRMVKDIIYVNDENIGFTHKNNASFPKLDKKYSLKVKRKFLTGGLKSIKISERPYKADNKDAKLVGAMESLPERKMRKNHSILFSVNNPSYAGIITLLAFRYLEDKLYPKGD